VGLFLSNLSCTSRDDGIAKPEITSEGKAVGIDLGLIDFVVTSDGSKFHNPKHLKRHANNLKRKQQKLSKKTRGSKTRIKARRMVAKVHGRIARVREDFLHKLSRKLVQEGGNTPTVLQAKSLAEQSC